jgi:hypothetical protein
VTDEQIEGIVASIVQDWLADVADVEPRLLICLCAPQPVHTRLLRAPILLAWYVERGGAVQPITAEGASHFIAQRRYGFLDFARTTFYETTDSAAIMGETAFVLPMATIPNAVSSHRVGWLLVVDEAGRVQQQTMTWRVYG